jgi:hypothetical protein
LLSLLLAAFTCAICAALQWRAASITCSVAQPASLISLGLSSSAADTALGSAGAASRVSIASLSISSTALF